MPPWRAVAVACCTTAAALTAPVLSRHRRHARRDAVGEAVADTLNDLQTDYLDLLLIHWPLKYKPGTLFARDGAQDFAETWAAMEALVKDGKVRSIGVSNFDAAQLEAGVVLHGPPVKAQLAQLLVAGAEAHVECAARFAGAGTAGGRRQDCVLSMCECCGHSFVRTLQYLDLLPGLLVEVAKEGAEIA